MSAASTPLLLDEINGQERSNFKFTPKMNASPLMINSAAPLARSESEDDGPDDREVVTKPYPGVDDGFFDNPTNNNSPDPEDNSFDPPAPRIPDIEVTAPTPDVKPFFTPRFGGDDDDPKDANKPDEADGTPEIAKPGSLNPDKRLLWNNGFGFDIEAGSMPGDLDHSIPDVNIYQHKKTLAQGMMDLALFSANANQLRYVLESFDRHPYFYPSIILIAISLLLQVSKT